MLIAAIYDATVHEGIAGEAVKHVNWNTLPVPYSAPPQVVGKQTGSPIVGDSGEFEDNLVCSEYGGSWRELYPEGTVVACQVVDLGDNQFGEWGLCHIDVPLL